MFSEQRWRLVSLLPAGSVAILTSNDLLPTNADGAMRFFQNVNLYYLSGIEQEETTLLLCPGHPDETLREILFIKRTNELFTKWHGRRLSKEQASEISGIKTVFYADELTPVLKKIIPLCDYIYLHTDEHTRSEKETETREERLLRQIRGLYPLHAYKRLFPLLARQRTVKTAAELEMLKKACDITGAGFRRVLKFIRPGVSEKQVEAEMIHEYMQHNAGWADYQPIVASGADSCILHYITNDKICKDGEVLLIDAAAGWHYYNADLTRTIPVNGRFTSRQKQYYNAVLKVQRQIRESIHAGVLMKDLQATCNELLLESLTELGLCSLQDIRASGKKYYLDKYCYHNFSHFIGLDVHDVAYFHEPLPAGAVITNEPGIYCQEEGIGVRLENNLAVTENGYVDLMAAIPIEAEEIETLMNSR
jgi:Xaa-Pro aminopeptidase